MSNNEVYPRVRVNEANKGQFRIYIPKELTDSKQIKIRKGSKVEIRPISELEFNVKIIKL